MLQPRRCLAAVNSPFGGCTGARPAPWAHVRPTAGSLRHWRDAGPSLPQRRRPTRSSARGSDQAGGLRRDQAEAAGAKQAGEVARAPLVVGWTLTQTRRFLGVVASLGGPYAALAVHVHELLEEEGGEGEGLNYMQVVFGLQKLRRRGDADAKTAGSLKPVRTSSTRKWFADARVRCDAAVTMQGGLASATAERTLEIMGDDSLTVTQVNHRLAQLREQTSSGRRAGGGGGGGGGGSSAKPGRAADGQEVDATPVGWASADAAPLVRHWTLLQQQQFRDTVSALGGPAVATLKDAWPLLSALGWKYEHVRGGMRKLESQERPLRPPSALIPFGSLTADQQQLFEAAMGAMGGLEWATADGILDRVPRGSGLTRALARSHLLAARKAQHGSDSSTQALQSVLLPGWTLKQHQRFEAVVLSQGGPFAASLKATMTHMLGKGLSYEQLRYSLLQWQQRHRTEALAAGLPSEDLAPLVAGWTLQQSQSFLIVANSLGGPYSASATAVHPVVKEDGLSFMQVEAGLQRLRRQAAREAAISGSPLPVRMASPPSSAFKWTADARARFDIAITIQGGLQVATPRRVHEVMGYDSLTVVHVRSRLWKLRSEASGGAGAGSGGSGAASNGGGDEHGSVLAASATERQEHAVAGAISPPAHEASPPSSVFKWTADARARFHIAVTLQGGLQLAKPRLILEAMGDAGLTIVQVKNRLWNLRREASGGLGAGSVGSDAGRGGGDEHDSVLAATADERQQEHAVVGAVSAPADEVPLVLGWTGMRHHQFVTAVRAAGGPSAAMEDVWTQLSAMSGVDWKFNQASRGLIKMRLWERGAGLDGGAAATATAVAATPAGSPAAVTAPAVVTLAQPEALDVTSMSPTLLPPPSALESVILLAPLPWTVPAPMLPPAPELGPALAAPPSPAPTPMPSPSLAQAPTLLPSSASSATSQAAAPVPAPALMRLSVADLLALYSAWAAVNASLQSDISELASSLRVLAQRQQPPQPQPTGISTLDLAMGPPAQPGLSEAASASATQPEASRILTVAQQRGANLAAMAPTMRKLRAQNAARMVSDAEADAAFEVTYNAAKAARGAEQMQKGKASRQSDHATILAVMASAPHQPQGGLHGDAWTQMCQLLGEEAALSL